MLSTRERELVLILFNNQNRFITGKELGLLLNVTDRTIRTDIMRIEPIIINHGSSFEKKAGHGYKLFIMNKSKFNDFLDKYIINFESSSKSLDVKERQEYLMKELLFKNYCDIDKISEQNYISESTTYKDLNELKIILKKYDLHLDIKKKKVLLSGNEINKRRLIMDTYFGKNYQDNLKNYMSHFINFEDISYEELVIIVLDETRESGISITDIILKNIVLHLLLSIKRVKEGFEIQTDIQNTEHIINTKEFIVSNNIFKRIEKIMSIEFPYKEYLYLTIHFVTKGNQKYIKKENLEFEVNEMIELLTEELSISLESDQQLYEGLLLHIEAMIQRNEQGIQLRNPLTEDIKKEHRDIFDTTKKTMCNMEYFKEMKISDDEIAYLCLHILASIEKIKSNKKIKTLIICATGYGSAQLIKNRVSNELGNQLLVVDVKGYYELESSDIDSVDLIISTVDVSTFFVQTPIVQVSVFLNELDVKHIKQKIESILQEKSLNQYVDKETIVTKKTIGNDVVSFTDYISKDNFLIFTSGETKEEVIDRLLDNMSYDEEENYKNKMQTQLELRENMGGIIFSDHIAVPHPVIPIGNKLKVGIGIIKEGLYWNEEFNNINFVFLLSTSKKENRDVIKITKKIIKLGEEFQIQRNMLIETNYQKFYKLFLEL